MFRVGKAMAIEGHGVSSTNLGTSCLVVSFAASSCFGVGRRKYSPSSVDHYSCIRFVYECSGGHTSKRWSARKDGVHDQQHMGVLLVEF